MAKQVSNIFINLGIKNAEGLDKLKSAFRELDKAVGPTSKSIDSAIAAVKRFSDSNERSEQLIRGQIEAFKGLRSQVDVGGNRYAALTNEIGKLQAELRGSTDALERQREKLLRTASAGSQNAKSLQTQITALERLKQQTRPGSSAFDQLTKDIDKARIALGHFKTEASQAASTVTAMPGSTFQKVADQVAILQRRMQTLNFSSAEFLKYQQRINLVNLVQSTTVGRQQVRANAELYASPQYGGFVRSRAEALSLPATPAGYQQRIGEINAELQNVSNLERRRELTLELDRLNRQLKGTIIDATSAEQRAVDVVRARVNAQREALGRGGFGAFSASLTGRDFKAEEQQQTVNDVRAAFSAIEAARENMAAAVQAVEQRTLQQELKAAPLIEESNQRAHAAHMQRKQKEADAGEQWFRQELARLDILAQQRKAAASALGLGGRDLSSLYERITGLATANVAQQQQFMGRNATQVYNDIATSFNKGGRPVDIINKSSYIGDAMGAGIKEGLTSTAASSADAYVEEELKQLKARLEIRSPSGLMKRAIGVPIGQGIGLGIIEGIRSINTQIQQAIAGVVAAPGKAPLPGAMGPLSSTAERLQAFVVQSAANAPSARRYSRLLGEGITSSGTIPLAMYRRAYERGELMPTVIGSLSERRRGRQYTIPGTPGYGLEQVLQAEATRAVGRTGAFVGPLSGALTQAGALGPLSAPRIPGGLSPGGTAPLPIFAASRSLAPLQGSLPGMAYALGGQPFDFPLSGPLGRSQTPTRSAASASLRESIGTYRKAIDNFWEGETNTFTTVRRIVSGSVQVNASRLARTLTETRTNLNSLTSETTATAGLPAATFARLRPVITARKAAFQRELAVMATAAGVSRMGGFPVEGMIGPSSPIGGGPRPPVPPTPIGPSGAGGEFPRLNAELTKFGALNRRSINDLQELKGVLSDVHRGLSPIATDYQKVNTAIEKQNILIDKELAKRQLGGGGARRLGGQQLAQIAGASISGGIFGGPEGLVGGVAGGIVGGVGGSFAGAAIGAQAGMLRQQLGGTADYAAQIGKLQIALRGVAGTQSNYNQALNAAAAATRDLNVPQMEAIQGITRLSAAVLGAGGTIGDANFAFRAISESIKATGGNAEQVDGAMLALTQVFSKGKVSAEELNQIAERLPGTFTLFAQATGKTGPELQKALQQGQVGLNDLMKFLELASSKYGQTALKIAASSEEAGARTKIAFDQMRLEVGKALQPLGAKFQAAFESFIKDIGPAVLAVTKGVSAALQFFFDNRAAASAAEFSLKVGLVASAFAALRAAMSAAVSLNIASWFSTTAASAKITGDVLTSTGAQVTGFKATLMGLQGVLSRLAAIGIITVTVDVLVQGYARLKAMEEELEKLRAERTSEGPTGPQLVMTAQRRYTGASRETVAADIEKQRNLLAALKKQYAEATGYRFELNIPGDVFSTQRRLAESELLRARIKKAEEVINLDLSQFKTRSEIEAERRADIDRRFGNLTPTDDTTTTRTRAAAREAAQDLKERQRLERELASLSDAAQRPIILSKQKILAFDLQIQRANADGMALEVGRLEIGKNKYELDLAKEKLLIDEREALQASADNEDQTNRLLRDRITQQKTVVALRELELNFAKDTALREAQLATTMEKQRESLASAFTDRRRELGLISRSEYTAALLERERRRLTSEAEGATPEQRAQALDLYRQQIDPTPFESITQQVGRLRDELEELSNSANIVKGAAQSIGESFSTSFTSLINGTATAQQALSGFFQSIANYFLDMAGKIIAKWIEMAILNTVLNLFPTGNLFGSSAGGGSFAGAWGGTAGQGAMGYLNTGPSLFAQGGVFGANKIVPYASGGVVTRPMLFPFANGGAIGTGLMGEAGPEAIMPLQRGPNGKLGVMAAGGGTTNVVVNVDATGGSSVQGDDDRANQLGKVISAAVQSELVKQKRPGGLLA